MLSLRQLKTSERFAQVSRITENFALIAIKILVCDGPIIVCLLFGRLLLRVTLIVDFDNFPL